MRFDALPRVVHLPSSSLAGLICKGVTVCDLRNGVVVRHKKGFRRKTYPVQPSGVLPGDQELPRLTAHSSAVCSVHRAQESSASFSCLGHYILLPLLIWFSKKIKNSITLFLCHCHWAPVLD